MRLVAVFVLTALALVAEQAYNNAHRATMRTVPILQASPLDNPLYELHVSRKFRRSYDLHTLMWYSQLSNRYGVLRI